MLGTDMINSVVSKLRNGIIGDIIKSYDSISLHGASTMMLLSADECKTGVEHTLYSLEIIFMLLFFVD